MKAKLHQWSSRLTLWWAYGRFGTTRRRELTASHELQSRLYGPFRVYFLAPERRRAVERLRGFDAATRMNR